ncbi:Hypothetical predicted protein [Marmota monax]|uniref:Uncharacterized protein n=1 Tax=Marmota monax TaxID=9995 RepID=A0A5E4AGU0_MARMO|nr:Hypothetical predicted protein [Marmota monax]
MGKPSVGTGCVGSRPNCLLPGSCPVRPGWGGKADYENVPSQGATSQSDSQQRGRTPPPPIPGSPVRPAPVAAAAPVPTPPGPFCTVISCPAEARPGSGPPETGRTASPTPPGRGSKGISDWADFEPHHPQRRSQDSSLGLGGGEVRVPYGRACATASAVSTTLGARLQLNPHRQLGIGGLTQIHASLPGAPGNIWACHLRELAAT